MFFSRNFLSAYNGVSVCRTKLPARVAMGCETLQQRKRTSQNHASLVVSKYYSEGDPLGEEITSSDQLLLGEGEADDDGLGFEGQYDDDVGFEGGRDDFGEDSGAAPDAGTTQPMGAQR